MSMDEPRPMGMDEKRLRVEALKLDQRQDMLKAAGKLPLVTETLVSLISEKADAEEVTPDVEDASSFEILVGRDIETPEPDAPDVSLAQPSEGIPEDAPAARPVASDTPADASTADAPQENAYPQEYADADQRYADSLSQKEAADKAIKNPAPMAKVDRESPPDSPDAEAVAERRAVRDQEKADKKQFAQEARTQREQLRQQLARDMRDNRGVQMNVMGNMLPPLNFDGGPANEEDAVQNVTTTGAIFASATAGGFERLAQEFAEAAQRIKATERILDEAQT